MGAGLGRYGQQPPWPVVATRTTWIPGLAPSPSCAGAGEDEALGDWCGGSQDPHRIFFRVLSVQRFRIRSLLGRGGTAG